METTREVTGSTNWFSLVTIYKARCRSLPARIPSRTQRKRWGQTTDIRHNQNRCSLSFSWDWSWDSFFFFCCSIIFFHTLYFILGTYHIIFTIFFLLKYLRNRQFWIKNCCSELYVRFTSVITWHSVFVSVWYFIWYAALQWKQGHFLWNLSAVLLRRRER